MFRSCLLFTTLCCLLVYVNTEFTEWEGEPSLRLGMVQLALNSLISEYFSQQQGGEKWETVTVDKFTLRKGDLYRGVVIGHTHNTKKVYMDFWVDGIGSDMESGGLLTVVIRSIYCRKYKHDDLDALVAMVEQDEKDGMAPSLPDSSDHIGLSVLLGF